MVAIQNQLMPWSISRASLQATSLVLIVSACCCFQFSAARAATLQQRLERKVSVTWRGQELATALTRLSRSGEIDLWLDRRVDRQQAIALDVVEVPLEAALRDICRDRALGMANLTNLVYIGPLKTANRLATLVEDARSSAKRLSPALRKRWVQPKPVTWSRLSEPRQLVRRWLSEANLGIEGEEQIPHDLWPEKELPPLALIDRLVLVLAGFDLTCRISADGKRCEIVRLAPLDIASSTAPVQPSVSKQPTDKQPSRKKTRQVYTLRLKDKPLGLVLNHFAKQMQLEFVWPAGATEEDRKQLVSCDVSKADFDELLTAILSGTSLQYRIQGDRVYLEARP